MAPHSSTSAWKIPWMEEPGRLQSMGSLRVRDDSATSLSLSTFMHWRRKWQPTPVFLPGESHGWRSQVGCSPWGRTELDTTEVTQQQQHSKLNSIHFYYFKGYLLKKDTDSLESHLIQCIDTNTEILYSIKILPLTCLVLFQFIGLYDEG